MHKSKIQIITVNFTIFKFSILIYIIKNKLNKYNVNGNNIKSIT